MTVNQIKEELNLKLLAGSEGLENEVNGAYIGDLLSWVMANCKEGNIWITIQGHINIVAVAALTNASCVIMAEGANMDDDTINKANSEGIPVLFSEKTSYDIAKDLVGLGI